MSTQKHLKLLNKWVKGGGVTLTEVIESIHLAEQYNQDALEWLNASTNKEKTDA